MSGSSLDDHDSLLDITEFSLQDRHESARFLADALDVSTTFTDDASDLNSVYNVWIGVGIHRTML